MKIIKKKLKSLQIYFTFLSWKLYSPNLKYEKEISIADKLTKKSFDNFISYQIKIVFYSGSPGYVTTIKDLVATAVLWNLLKSII